MTCWPLNNKAEYENHNAFCDVLKDRFGITLSFMDFVSKYDDVTSSVNSLNCMVLQGHDRLLVITCAYSLREASADSAFQFDIDSATVQFHMVEAFVAVRNARE